MTEPNSPYLPPNAPPGVPPVPRKPPLSRGLKRAASVAGAVSFTVMSIGWGLIAIALGIGLVAGIVTALMGAADVSRDGRDLDYRRLAEFLESINPAAWVIPLVFAGLVGIALWVGSLFISRGMLARAGHPSPWGVTWAGVGIAIAASWVLSWVAWLPLQFAGLITPDAFPSSEGGLAITIAMAILFAVLNLALTAAIGWFAWWWMAHVMRPAVPAAN